MLNSTELTTDDKWRMFEAACNEVGIHPVRCPDRGNVVAYRMRLDEVHDTVLAHKAVALCNRAMGAQTIACWCHAHDWDTTCAIPVDDVIRDPWTKCGDA